MTAVNLRLLEEYLPNPLKRLGNEYRTWLEPSRSRSHLTINLDKEVFYDFHTNSGGSLASLLRQLGAPISKDLAGAEGWKRYQFQLSVLQGMKSQGMVVRCGTQTAVWRHKQNGSIKMVARVMCLKWKCPKCAPFLRRVWIERLASVHFVGVYSIPKGHRTVGTVLYNIKRRAKRIGGQFEWLLCQANEYQILFVEGSTSANVYEWLDNEPFFEQVVLMPAWSLRNEWLGKGLEKMEEAMNWTKKVRYSRDLFSHDNDSNAADTSSEFRTSTTADDKPEASGQVGESEYERVIVPYPIEDVVAKLEQQGYTVQWCSEEGLVAFVIPPRNGPI